MGPPSKTSERCRCSRRMGRRAGETERRAHSRAILSVLSVLTLLLAVLAGHAQGAPRPGSLDPSFGDNGKVLPELASTFLQTEFTGLARLPDGSLILSANRENRRAEIEGAIERRG